MFYTTVLEVNFSKQPVMGITFVTQQKNVIGITFVTKLKNYKNYAVTVKSEICGISPIGTSRASN